MRATWLGELSPGLNKRELRTSIPAIGSSSLHEREAGLSVGAAIERAAACGTSRPRGPRIEHDGGDRSIYVEDPAGNVVEVRDFFARRPIEALSDDERFRSRHAG